MDEKELRKLLEDPKRILNVARVFHHLLHEYDKMEEQKAKQKDKGAQKTKLKDSVEVVLKDKDGNIKAHIQS